MPNICSLDGVLVPEHEAVVPVLDRGFLFGDSIYEVIRTRNGRLFAWQEHLDRLRASADSLAMRLDLDDREIVRRLLAAMTATGLPEHYLRIVVTRGTGTAPSIDLRAAPGPCRWVILARSLPPAPGPVRLQTIERLRNDRRALDPAAKTGNYLNNVLGLHEAQAQGGTDCLFLNGSGHVTEASTSNLFARLDGAWCTPPCEAGILRGVTRALLVEFLRGRGEAVHETNMTPDDLRRADALFLSSTLRDVGAASHLDGMPMPEGPELDRVEQLARDFAAYADARAATVDDPRARALAG
jgi:branched-chain amino acid aminotransferase